MRELDIVFTKSLKKFPIGSWLIRWYTKKPYSHVARHLVLYGDIDMYYQASEGKVNYEVKEIFDGNHEIVLDYKLLITDEVYKQISRACVAEAGKPYGVMQNIGIALVDIVTMLGYKMSNPFKKGRNCSELLYLNVLKPMFPDLDYDPDIIKPHQIEEIIENRCQHLTVL